MQDKVNRELSYRLHGEKGDTMKCRCCGRSFCMTYVGRNMYVCEPAIGGCGHTQTQDSEKKDPDGKEKINEDT